MEIIGKCSLCGGDVYGHKGAWFAVIPPPLSRCSGCGAVEKREPTIEMVPTIPMESNRDGRYARLVVTSTKSHA